MSIKYPLGINAGTVNYYNNCPYLNILKASKALAPMTSSIGWLSPLSTVTHNYTAFVSPDITGIRVNGSSTIIKPVDGVVTFDAATPDGTKDAQLVFITRTPTTAVVSAIVRTDFIEDFRAGNIFTPDAIATFKDFYTIRFMDYCRTNDAGFTAWTKVETDCLNGVAQPIEYMAELCNQTYTNAWFNIPHTLPMAEAVRVIKQFRSLLNPNLQLFVEWSNEVWNTMFIVGKIALATGNSAQYYANNCAALSKEIANITGVKMLLNWQFVNPKGMQKVIDYFKLAGGVWSVVEAVGCAPYIWGIGSTTCFTMTDDQLIAILVANRAQYVGKFKEWGAMAALNKVKFVKYEENVDVTAHAGATVAEQNRRVALSRLPIMADLLSQNWQAFTDAGGSWGCLFTAVAGASHWGIAKDFDDYTGDPRRQAALAWNKSAWKQLAMSK